MRGSRFPVVIAALPTTTTTIWWRGTEAGSQPQTVKELQYTKRRRCHRGHQPNGLAYTLAVVYMGCAWREMKPEEGSTGPVGIIGPHIGLIIKLQSATGRSIQDESPLPSVTDHMEREQSSRSVKERHGWIDSLSTTGKLSQGKAGVSGTRVARGDWSRTRRKRTHLAEMPLAASSICRSRSRRQRLTGMSGANSSGRSVHPSSEQCRPVGNNINL